MATNSDGKRRGGRPRLHPGEPAISGHGPGVWLAWTADADGHPQWRGSARAVSEAEALIHADVLLPMVGAPGCWVASSECGPVAAGAVIAAVIGDPACVVGGAATITDVAAATGVE